jgi:dihydrofolate synthase/folylpolyglutamate synthase
MNTADEIKKNLFSRTGYGIKYDLERMIKASRECGNPQNSFKSFHIAGTNGKGSTCAYLEQMLRSYGYSTGLYTSPHVINFEERFRIDSKPVSEELWMEVYLDLKQIIEQYELTFFEATTLMAFELFKRKNVSWCVIETGLGGRLDATNIIRPVVSVITAIDIDHKEYLGETIESIANEKFGIIKEDAPVVLLKNKNQLVMQNAVNICHEKRSQLVIVDPERYEVGENVSGVTVKDDSGEQITVNMRGTFQISNLLLAVKAFSSAGFAIDQRVVRGVSETFLPCRFQVLSYKDKTIILDVGHNPQAASMVVAEIGKRFKKRSVCMVVGIMKDKDYPAMIRKYCTVASRIIFTQPEISRAASTEMLQSSIEITDGYSSIKSVAVACNDALNGPEEIICITGSFHTVGEACIALGVDPFSH